MRILHLCLSCYYVDNFNYQENVLPRQNKEDGHEVKIIASTETFIGNEIGYVKPSTYFNEDGIEVTRVPYRKILPRSIMAKVRSYPEIHRQIVDYNPDVIFHHGVPSSELGTLAKFKKTHPLVRIYLDSHEDYHNSARGLISREILHRGLYKRNVQQALPYIDKVFYISLESKDFISGLYGVPEEKMEYYPLGGTIIDGIDYRNRREKIREKLQVSADALLFVHSGKMDSLKRTDEIIEAFTQVKDARFRLILIGSFSDEMKGKVDKLMKNDSRIVYEGWKHSSELMDYLCAADMYVQPGGQSATLQNAICCGCPVMVYPHKSHYPFMDGNGYFVEDVKDMIRGFENIALDSDKLNEMRMKSYEIAYNILDYRKLAAKLYVTEAQTKI